jgi:methanogenic corrinoid protein MtbC1
MERNEQRAKGQVARGAQADETGSTALSDFMLCPPAPLQPDRLRAVLSQVLRADIVPQLLLADKSVLNGGSGDDPARSVLDKSQPTRTEREQFEVVVLYRDTFECFSFVDALRQRGVSLRDIYLGLFQPVARELGRRWSEDSLTFMEVTKAVGQIQTMIRAMGPGDAKPGLIDDAHRIVLACPASEQHSLGMLVVSQLFEMEGWDVQGGAQLSTGQPLNDVVHDGWYGVVGLSASCEESARELKSAIDQLRKASLNRSVSVIVGGNGFIEHPEISIEIGADDVATDARDAINKAEDLLVSRNNPASDR